MINLDVRYRCVIFTRGLLLIYLPLSKQTFFSSEFRAFDGVNINSLTNYYFYRLFAQPLDIGSVLSGGCYGFAAKYMHWPEELLVGGAKHNRSGYLTKASSLQTVIQLMTPLETYDFWKGNYKVAHHIDWTVDKAAKILKMWQLAFTKELHRLTNSSAHHRAYNYYDFSTDNLNDILKTYSEMSPFILAIGACAVVRLAIFARMLCFYQN